jgi:hypothetical protein
MGRGATDAADRRGHAADPGPLRGLVSDPPGALRVPRSAAFSPPVPPRARVRPPPPALVSRTGSAPTVRGTMHPTPRCSSRYGTLECPRQAGRTRDGSRLLPDAGARHAPRTRGGRGRHHLPDDGLHRRRQPGDPLRGRRRHDRPRGRPGARGPPRRDHPRGVRRHAAHGALRAAPVRRGAVHGGERLPRVHRRRGARLHLPAGPRRGPGRRVALRDPDPSRMARLRRPRRAGEPEARLRRGHRVLPRAHRAPRDRRRGPRPPHGRPRPARRPGPPVDAARHPLVRADGRPAAPPRARRHPDRDRGRDRRGRPDRRGEAPRSMGALRRARSR